MLSFLRGGGRGAPLATLNGSLKLRIANICHKQNCTKQELHICESNSRNNKKSCSCQFLSNCWFWQFQLFWAIDSHANKLVLALFHGRSGPKAHFTPSAKLRSSFIIIIAYICQKVRLKRTSLRQKQLCFWQCIINGVHGAGPLPSRETYLANSYGKPATDLWSRVSPSVLVSTL